MAAALVAAVAAQRHSKTHTARLAAAAHAAAAAAVVDVAVAVVVAAAVAVAVVTPTNPDNKDLNEKGQSVSGRPFFIALR